MTRVAPWYGPETTYCYIARCVDGSLYTGITSNLERRIEIHNAGRGSRYTRGRLPISIVYFERLRNRSEALRREAEIKRLRKVAKERLVNGGSQSES